MTYSIACIVGWGEFLADSLGYGCARPDAARTIADSDGDSLATKSIML